MKKFFIGATLLLLCGSYSFAQKYYQIPNSDFEDGWKVNTKTSFTGKVMHQEDTPSSWNSFFAAKGKVSGSAFLIKDQTGTVIEVTGYDNQGKAAKIVSRKNTVGSISNGNLTTGIINMGSMTASSPENYNYTSLSDASGRCSFAGLPDSVSVYFRFKAVSASQGKASMNMILHSKKEYKDPTAIMGKEDSTAFLIAKAFTTIDSLDEWKCYTVPFKYNGNKYKDSTDLYMLASFSTNQYPGKGSSGDSLSIDHIRMIYNSKLASLKYNGPSVTGFKKDIYDYKMPHVSYNKSKLSFTFNGKGANADTIFDESTRILKITVKGNDHEINPENQHIYTIEFGKADAHLSSLSIDKDTIKNFDKETYTYEALEIPYDSTRVEYTLVDDLSSVSKNYNEDTGLLKLTVSASDIEANPKHFRTYTIQFRTPPVVKTDNYQFPNGDFEEGWALNKKYSAFGSVSYTEETPNHWRSFGDAKGELAPTALLLFAGQTGTVMKTAGVGSGFGVTIMGRQNFMRTISNGNLTTGFINMESMTATDSVNYNYSDVNNKRGNCSFAGIPDSVSVYFRFIPKDKSLGKASMTMILHDKFNYADPSKILGEEDSISHLIARAYTAIDSTDTWKKYTVPFMYNGEKYKESAENYMLASFSTNQTPGAGSHGDSLSIDKIEVIYNSRIDSILINGTPLTDFSKDKYDYDCPTINNDAEVIVYADGIGASVEKTMDNDRKKMTIIVKGNDYIENNDNLHTYTIQFKNTPVSIKDIPMNESDSKDVYDVQGRRVINTQKGIVIQQGKKTLKK